MEPTTTYRPRIARETRLLLGAATLAVLVLWLLARIRFQDRPSPPSPIPAVLSQLSTGPKLDELATEVADVGTRLRSAVIALPASAGAPRGAARVAALRVRDDVAVAWLPASARRDRPDVIAIDRASGIALVRAPGPRAATSPAAWTPRAPLGPRFVVASEVAGADVAFRPAFLAALDPVATPLWPAPVWALPPASDLSAGSLVFTSNAEIVGLVIAFAGQRMIVPAATLLAQAERLLGVPRVPAGTLGVHVQALTPGLAAATGGTSGVIAAWVDGEGPAHGRLRIGDVIEAVDGRAVNGRSEWDVVAARLAAGTTVTLRVRRRGAVQDVPVVAAAASARSTDTLGLALRPRPRAGTEIVDVEPGSAGERAGLAAADVITLIGEVAAPTPRQVTRSFAALGPGERVIVGVSRSGTHVVTTLDRSP